MRRALRLTEDLLRLDPDHPRAAGNKVYYENSLKEEGGSVKKKGESLTRSQLNNRPGGKIPLLPGEDLLGDSEDPNQFTVTEEEGDVNDPMAVVGNDERAAYERLCRGEAIEGVMTEKLVSRNLLSF